MSEATVRPMLDSDVPAVLEVLRLALGETALLRRTPDLWNWKHRDNPFGGSLTYVAEVDGEVAGVRAMMRWDLVTSGGEVLRCLRPVDTATHPGFGRRGIFQKLTLAAIDEATERGIHLIFNTPNSSSGPGYLKMGWKEVGPIGVMVRPLIRRGPKVTDQQAPELKDFFPGAPPPADTTIQDRSPMGLRTPRSPQYLDWRFSRHPTARYLRLDHDGQTAFLRPNVRSGRKEVVVSDVIGAQPARVIREAARISRAAYLAGWFSPASAERAAAIRGGLIPVPGIRALTLMARPLRDLPVDVLELGTWDITLGDLELL